MPISAYLHLAQSKGAKGIQSECGLRSMGKEMRTLPGTTTAFTPSLVYMLASPTAHEFAAI